MKLTTLLIVLATLQSIGNGFSQTMEVTLDLKNTPVSQIFSEIEKQSNFRFLYINEVVKDKNATLNVKKEPIDRVLDRLMADVDMKYTVLENNLIVITPSKLESKQGILIKGTVTASLTGEALPGVNVLEKGTLNGAITDINGNYSITISSAEAVLVFSSVGYNQEEVVAGTQTTLNVALIESIEALDEVVVVGYGTTLKKNLTTSVVKVAPDDLPKAAVSGASDLLFGKAAGVQVRQYSSQPGGKIDLSIRGRGTPLIVVDGVVVPSDALESSARINEVNQIQRGNLGGLNPNDIESIEILKDASAAIYGVNASNGVILITTKKGKEGRVNISYNGNISLLKNHPYLEPLNSREFMQYYNIFERDMYLANNNMLPFGPNTPDYVPSFTEEDINNRINTDWIGQLLRDGSIQNHNISVNGGNEKISYYFSGGYFDQVGTIKNSGMEKFTGFFDLTAKPSKFFTLNVTANGNRSSYNNSVAGWQSGGGGSNNFTALQSALAYPPYLPVYNDSGGYYQFGFMGNPLSLLEVKDNSLNNALFVKTSLDINFIPEVLTGRILYGNNYESSLRDYYMPSDVNWSDTYRSRGSLEQTNRQNQTFETYLTFNKKISDLVNVSLVAGFGEYHYNAFSFSNQFFDVNDLFGSDHIDGGPTNGFSWKDKSKQRSYFTRGSFDVLDRYLITAAWRYDGVDQFFPGNKYAGFPSISLGWKISNESFMSSMSMIDILKLRVSYGTTGQNLPRGVAYGLFSTGGDLIPFDDGNIKYIPYLLSTVDVPSLTWQKTVMQNIGLDFEVFKSRLSGSIELFQDDVTNLLRWANTPALSMVSSQPINGGHTRRKGIDVALEGDILRNSNLKWNMAVNLSHYSYRWVTRFKEDDRTSYLNEDDPYRSIYAFETNGILQLEQEIPAWQPAAAQVAGSPIFVDQNQDAILDSADVIVYDQTPKLILGINNTFTYKNFDLGFYIYGQLGSFKQNYSLNWANARNFVAGSSGGESNATQDIKDAWSTENTGGTLPGSTYNESTLGNIGNTVGWGSDYTISKADFIRVRNITFGYTLNSPKLKRYFQSLRLYADVQNAFIITKYKGADPEVESPATKGAAAPYPMYRNYSLGLNINF
ncbi:MAG: SusC/RagA family TonB-linked outer membrane protein [Bacteroidales bacterium]|nr:SusC/RagA family TonB-linked outer membrane protein [Bacteroidales bacterium]